MTRAELEKMVREIDPVNAEYILENRYILSKMQLINEYEEKGNSRSCEYVMEDLRKAIQKFDSTHLVPTNAKVGDGATVVLWSDRYACTITKVTRCTITMRRDKAAISPDFKPDFIPGGFFGTVINQDEQEWTYEPNPDGTEYKFNWSKKYQMYGQPNNMKAIKGRHEFYDYNF